MDNIDSTILKHFHQSKSIVNSNISKGMVSDAFGYSNAIKITKTGKEMKAGFETLMKACQSEKDAIAKKMNDCLSKCSIVPTQEPSSYLFGPYKSKFVSIPKMFSWKEMSALRKSNQKEYVESVVSKSETTDQYACCDQYNDCCRDYIRKSKELFLIDTIINGLEDSKKYELTTQQAGLLGF